MLKAITILPTIEETASHKTLLNKFIDEFNYSMRELTQYCEKIYKPYLIQDYRKDPNAIYFDILYDNRLIGFFGLSNDRELLTTWIVEFYLDKRYRNLKYCSDILNYVQSYMLVENMKYLSIGVFNIKSIISLTKKLGFNPVTMTMIKKL